MKKIFKQFRLIYLIPVLAICLPWFFKPGYLFFIDFVWGPIMHTHYTDSAFYWEIIIRGFSFILPHAFVQKLYIAIALFLVLLGAKKIIEQFIDQKWLVFVISLFALFNPFVYDRILYGQIGLVLSMALISFSVGYLIEYLSKKDKKQIILAAIFSGIAIHFSIHVVFFLIALYGLFGIFWLIRLKDIGIKALLINIAIIGVIVTALNAHWLSAFIYNSSYSAQSVQTLIERQDFYTFQTSGDSSLGAIKNVVMMSGFWGKDQFRYLDLSSLQGFWGKSFFILSVLLILGIYLGIKEKKYRMMTIGLLISYLVVLILAVGIRAPIAEQITVWLADNFGPYKGMRDTQKWVALMVIIYTIFLTLGAKQLFRYKIFKINKVSTTVLVALIIILQSPFLLFGLWGQSKIAEYPQDWHEVDEFLVDNTDCGKQTIFLPWHLYLGFSWVGGVISNPAPFFFKCDMYESRDAEFGGIKYKAGDDYQIVENWVKAKGDYAEIDQLNIKYIILVKETDWGNYAWVDDLEGVAQIKDSKTLRMYEFK